MTQFEVKVASHTIQHHLIYYSKLLKKQTCRNKFENGSFKPILSFCFFPPTCLLLAYTTPSKTAVSLAADVVRLNGVVLPRKLPNKN